MLSAFVGSGSWFLALAIAAAPPPANSQGGGLLRILHKNELDAVATLRQIAAAEETFKADVRIDTNCDGIGEFGYLAELAGTKPMRIAVGCTPAAGPPSNLLSPPLLPSVFGKMHGTWITGGCRASHHGYRFMMFLPSLVAGGVVAAIVEDGTGGKAEAPFPGPVTGASYWCCYAWPIRYGQTGLAAFVVNQDGVVLECRNNQIRPFDGERLWPLCGEAYENPTDMASTLRIGTAGGPMNTIWNVAP